MNPRKKQQLCNNLTGICGLDPKDSYQPKTGKAIELYAFIDPFSAECWSFEPIMKKLVMEYGEYFRIRVLLTGKLKAWNLCTDQKNSQQKKLELAQSWDRISTETGMSCDGDYWLENQRNSPFTVALAIKAAELQGPQKGGRFLRKLREKIFLEKQDITNINTLTNCCLAAGLDVEEFLNDLDSTTARKALECDITTTNDMDVETVPTFVFFNDDIEQDGIKVPGIYKYEVYQQVIEEMLGYLPPKKEKLSIESFIKKYEFVASIEIAVVYDLSLHDVKKELTPLILQQRIEQVPVKHGTFWRYVGT
ncbi:ClpXP adapter SpxH family protein [Alkalihalobacillus pseudalcaliphilus]|uniref:ClpXP adapter SpxH family protein n=1 Tax=Alkalihalobacillus pseudalcaliphilus TaxID=79884 RepID=UPI00064DAFAC|nr:ClpXP adapter SpxH family protein [Alkalihalobacillus pseudalcaliphilus]KMK77302.1 dithiol-disulfide isomerase [Alkalihalobacillus pseudalcaliphilus]